MTVAIEMGLTTAGVPATLDLEELLATRLLVQGNSGSGKSHLLRRLLEQSAAWVQQTIIDPEGDFVTLADAYGHIPLEASGYSLAEVTRFGERAREHRASVVLNLEGLEADEQMRSAAAFLTALFDALVLSYEVGCLKPDPKIFLRACGMLSVDPERVLMIGDTPADAGAVNAGCAALIVPASSPGRPNGLHRAVSLALP